MASTLCEKWSAAPRNACAGVGDLVPLGGEIFASRMLGLPALAPRDVATARARVRLMDISIKGVHVAFVRRIDPRLRECHVCLMLGVGEERGFARLNELCTLHQLLLLVRGESRQLAIDPDASHVVLLWDAKLAEGFCIAVERLATLERHCTRHDVSRRRATAIAQDRRLHRGILHFLDALICSCPFDCSWTARGGAERLTVRARALLRAPSASPLP
mmetsp:Transcript_61473/g.148033  ORF Transcript_61473/g.148033 Transcript_61473/m.148033 type:complete len:217 (-) Transcript_61473:86-736(-)